MNHPRLVTPLKTLVAVLLAACLVSPTAGLQAAEQQGATASSTVATSPGSSEPATEIVLPLARLVSPTASVAQAGPAADAASTSAKLRRVHIGLGANYVSSAGVATLESVMRAVSFDHGYESCFLGCRYVDFPRVDRNTTIVPDVRVDYSLNRKWAVGLAYAPIGSHRVSGREEVPNVDYRPTYSAVTELAASYEGQAIAVTASLFPIPDASLKKGTLRASVGIGIGRIKTSIAAGPFAGSGGYFQDEVRESQKTVPAIVVSADWVRFFNRVFSLNVGVQYRYISFALGPQTIQAAYSYFAAPAPPGEIFAVPGRGAVSVAIPKRTINAGGIGFGVGIGFHF
jgi:hypothetical protein